MTHDALVVLGLEQQATASEIKMAYRDKVKQWHPDQFGADPERSGEAEGRLIELNRAYNVLQSYDPRPEQQRDGTPRGDVKPAALRIAPTNVPSGIPGRASHSKWLRAVWVGFAVAAISVLGFRLNSFVADDNDLARAASASSAATAETTVKMPAMTTPTMARALPVRATAIKTPTLPTPSTVSRIPAGTLVASQATPALNPARPLLVSRTRSRHASSVAATLPSDPEVPDLTLGERLEIRTECLSEATGGDPGSYQDCFLHKLEEHPRPIHLE